jgi:GTP-binding protein YchF
MEGGAILTSRASSPAAGRVPPRTYNRNGDNTMKAGLVGLPLAGKSALFQLLTGAAPPTARPEARVGIAKVPDARVDALARMFSPRKTTPATVEYVDVPGIVKGEQGAALVDLPALRGVDALVHVVRAFENDLAPHPEGSVDVVRDAGVLELELMLADLSQVTRRLERLDQNIKKARRAEDVAEKALFQRLQAALEGERPLREAELSDEDRRTLRSYSLLTAKPMLVVANLGEDRIAQAPAFLESSGLQRWADRPGVGLVAVSAPIEAEMAQLSPDDAAAFRADYGLSEPGVDRLARASYALLGLISFLTAGEDECRAWTIRSGTRAQQAAGAIHSDIERGFIRAEVVAYEELMSAGSIAACRDRGTFRLEGKEYVVRDGDVINFRFSV